MATRDKIAGTLFLIVGSLLITAAFRPELWSRLFGFALLTTLGTILVIAGAYHLATARTRAESMSQQLANASSFRRLWFPARYYTSKNLLWQFRVIGGMLITAGLMTAFVAFLMRGRGL